MELSARIVTLRLAETFVIARESSDEEDVVQVELTHDGVTGFGEGAPIERYGESGESALAYLEAAAGGLGDDPFALEQFEESLPPRRARGPRRARRRAARPAGEAARDSGLEAARAAAHGPADVLDRLARRPGRHGQACREGSAHGSRG